MKKYLSHSSEETKKIAQQFAENLQGGEILGLVGDLGSGKTNFVQGLAQFLQIKNTVNSPTFVVMKPYPTGNKKCRLLIHIDCYRLNSTTELQNLGVEEYFQDPKCLTVVEWADKIKDLMPPQTIWIRFRLGKKIDEREIEINNLN